ncbi:MAG TPA: hypothetical protein VGC47_00985 [Acidimicrobiia bacterium]
MIILRLVIGILIGLAVVVGLVPLWILLDLRNGGSGWGICSGGFGACRTSYFAGFELLIVYLVVMALLLLAIRVCVRATRWIDRSDVPLLSRWRSDGG